jgi:hypothetical protein
MSKQEPIADGSVRLEQRLVISIHIPKTAGTTLAAIFERCLNRRVLFDYAGYDKEQVAAPEILDGREFIKRYFAVLHGHFLAKKYLDVFPDSYFVATVRHPVERVISQYLHELNEASSDSWYHQDIVSGRMDVVDFARQDGVGDAITRHLSGRELKDYDLIFVSEQMLESCQLFSRKIRPLDLATHFGMPPKLPAMNHRADREQIRTFDETLRQAIYRHTQADNAVYTEAMERFVAEKRCLLS